MVGRIKKAKGRKKCIIKRRFTFEDYKKCLKSNEIILRSRKSFKSEAHNVFTENVNKVAINFINDKKLQSFNGLKSYLYRTNAGKVCREIKQKR